MDQSTQADSGSCDTVRPRVAALTKIVQMDGGLGLEISEEIVALLGLKGDAEITLEVRDGALWMMPSCGCGE